MKIKTKWKQSFPTFLICTCNDYPISEHVYLLSSMTYSNYYYDYKYPQYQTIIGLPVGIGICVLIVCISICCQKRKNKLKRQREKLNSIAQDAGESQHPYSVLDSDATKIDTSQINSTLFKEPVSIIDAKNSNFNCNDTNLFQKSSGKWLGITQRDGSVPMFDECFFLVKGQLIVGTNTDRIGPYAVDGIVNLRQRSIVFAKLYATSGQTLEYDCKFLKVRLSYLQLWCT